MPPSASISPVVQAHSETSRQCHQLELLNIVGGPVTVSGTGIGAQAIENLVRKYARRAGLEAVTPYTLRHTFGKSALDASVDLVTVAWLLGHDSVETTAIYTQPSARDLEQAVERLAIE